MINKKEIKDKINSIQSTKKITQAMEMISIIKIKKLQLESEKITPFLNILTKVVKNLFFLSQIKKEKNIFFVKKNINKILFIIILSTKGLCGSLNGNLFKKFFYYFNNFVKKKTQFEIIILGKKNKIFLKTFKKNISIFNTIFYKNFNITNVFEFSKNLLKKYQLNKINEIFIIFNKFKNKTNYLPTIEKLLPFECFKKNSKKFFKSWDYIYESNSYLLHKKILYKFFKMKLYNCILENLICENSSRMLVMKNATESSSNIVKELKFTYNKARQYNITQELIEIISGASAVLMD
ncbi:MAG: ATP synthase F1 subunit gamma [Buchnera aphidicola (Periphyllus lyropictus)]|uniref:ATP synthase F1 subunit gamma n=1 Tax=Buchnera aphidicola TaxID=9 RepID=UPI001ECE413E|nr:ATP synthase F1 subunit gamma [Buchnera aphidicola]NIH16798.1 ATP synthase F1 subunit gamma [Buchnera aphidicola (Periphyllus lyropictus)]USS94694.1 ATP synthase F1 subunit gamma [Buchnera aphidicola (Periphyllus lyropictus)]